MDTLSLHIVDYAIIGCLCVCTVAIAFGFACVRPNVADYLHGNGNMASFPVTLSMTACYISFATIQVCTYVWDARVRPNTCVYCRFGIMYCIVGALYDQFNYQFQSNSRFTIE